MSDKGSCDFDCPMYVDFLCLQDLTADTTDYFRNRISPSSRPETVRVPVNEPHDSVSSSENNFDNKTDSYKMNLQKMRHTKRMSRSEGALNLLTAKKSEIGRKRSLSECETRPKKKTYPVTPMCLKRPKAKKLKTTEELELEKIAELQKQTRLLLRCNELSMKRLNLKPKPSTLPVPRFSSRGDANQKLTNKFIAMGNIFDRSGTSSKNQPGKTRADKDLDEVFTPGAKSRNLPSTSQVSHQLMPFASRMMADKSEKKVFKNNPKPISTKRMLPHSGLYFNRGFENAPQKLLNASFNSHAKPGNDKEKNEKQLVPTSAAFRRFGKENIISTERARAIVEEVKRNMKKDKDKTKKEA